MPAATQGPGLDLVILSRLYDTRSDTVQGNRLAPGNLDGMAPTRPEILDPGDIGLV